ncbi:MAG: N-6 DNA methylase [Pirellulaceae bacterium]|nr:N-6 DNA methylase [Pirellulaceae bacterium]
MFAWHRSADGVRDKFDWEKASKYLTVPILRKLFRELTDPAQLDSWDNLTEVMGWAADTLNRVDRAAFFAKFHDAHAVQYFYEPFLESFDPELRKQLGVWYTPPEIVKYMVARVDQVLRSDFGRPDGLADPGVYVLDPCCGTGAYLVEVLRTIAATLADQGEGALRGGQLKQAAMDRVFGFEILPAPFVVAHLQLGLFLQDHGVAFEEKKKERAAVFLTNSLTGWQPPVGPKATLTFPEMTEERDLADRVKRGVPILVVLGNPPYNGFAGLPAEEEAGIVEPYRTTKTAPKPQGQGLNDLYVRFWRIAERCITERNAQHGIVCYISNYSWLDGLSHTGLRERFLEEFDQIWIDNLHGNRFISEYAPDGRTSETVFAVTGSSPGIRIGTAIAMAVRKEDHSGSAKVFYRDWEHAKAEERRTALLNSALDVDHAASRQIVNPIPVLGLAFRPLTTAKSYTSWARLTELFPKGLPGVQTKRDDFLVDFDHEPLRKRIADYFDSSMPDEEFARLHPSAVKDTQRYNWRTTRASLLKRGILASNIVKYCYRPFDFRWVYWEPETKLLGEKSPECFRNSFPGNVLIEARQKESIDSWTRGTVCHYLPDNFGNGFSTFFPLYVRELTGQKELLSDDSRKVQRKFTHPSDGKFDAVLANLSEQALEYVQRFDGVSDHSNLFHHAIAIMHAPSYATENGSALRQDWPRIPLPKSREQLVASADLGRQVAALLDPETPVPGVTAGKVRPELKLLGVAAKVGGGQLAGADFTVAARWGIAGKGGITMPGPGDSRPREFTAVEREALSRWSPGFSRSAAFPEPPKGGTPTGTPTDLLGPDTLDIHLNDAAYWQNVPRQVWEYTLGGYQVLKKWLSYREQALLGRPLAVDEVAYITHTIRRIAGLLLLAPELDANYAAVKADTHPWPQEK